MKRLILQSVVPLLFTPFLSCSFQYFGDDVGDLLAYTQPGTWKKSIIYYSLI